MKPPSTGPISMPTVAVMLRVAIALGVGRDERTICTWLPVQKKARATPWSAAETASAAMLGDRTSNPTATHFSSAAALITLALDTTRISDPSCHRVSTWTAADNPMRTPATVFDRPSPTTNSGKATRVMPRLTEKSSAPAYWAKASRRSDGAGPATPELAPPVTL